MKVDLVKVYRGARIWRVTWTNRRNLQAPGWWKAATLCTKKPGPDAGDRVERWLWSSLCSDVERSQFPSTRKKIHWVQSSGGNTTLVWNDLNIDVCQWSQENFILNPQMIWSEENRLTENSTTPVTSFISEAGSRHNIWYFCSCCQPHFLFFIQMMNFACCFISILFTVQNS